VGQLANTLDEQYDVSVPIVDLFRWGTPSFSTDGVIARWTWAERRRGRHLPAVRVPAGGHRLADLDPERASTRCRGGS